MSLRVEALSVRFQGILALDRVGFSLEPGSIVGVIGPNGAGKTTLLDAICGLVPHRGRVFIGDDELTGLSPARRATLGLSRSFQDARLFPSLTTREALTLARQRHEENTGAVAQLLGWPTTITQERRLAVLVNAALDLFGLGDYADKFVSELSTGTRRVVELAAVHLQDPRVILLDEPSAGIAQREVEALAGVISRLHHISDAAILIVEHDIPMVRLVADRLIALDYGQLIGDGRVDEVLAAPAVIESYLGTNDRTIARSGRLKGEGLVEVSAAEAAEETALVVPPGLPARDDFKVPTPRLGAGLAAGALAVLLAGLLAGPPPRLTQATAVHTQPSPSVEASPSPSPDLSAPIPSPEPEPTFPSPPPVDFPPEGSAMAPPSPSPTPKPSPSPSPSPSCLLPLPAPLPCVP